MCASGYLPGTSGTGRSISAAVSPPPGQSSVPLTRSTHVSGFPRQKPGAYEIRLTFLGRAPDQACRRISAPAYQTSHRSRTGNRQPNIEFFCFCGIVPHRRVSASVNHAKALVHSARNGTRIIIPQRPRRDGRRGCASRRRTQRRRASLSCHSGDAAHGSPSP